MKKRSVASGGSSTINGVLYQLLWSLLRATQLHVIKAMGSDTESVTLILEPRGGGGDIQVKGASHLIVEQLKARSDGGTWSLREIIEDVLPDLLIASQESSAISSYRFVTEGKMGEWKSVYEEFFQDLANREFTDNPLEGLDDQNDLQFRRSKVESANIYFPNPCTEQDLFLVIVKAVSSRPVVAKWGLTENKLQWRVRGLLSRFEFIERQELTAIQNQIDQLLLAIVEKQENISSTRDHLAVELAKAASEGGAEIDADRFFRDNGLNSVPLTDWLAHITRAGDLIRKSLDRRRYSNENDVRATELPQLPMVGNVLVVTGDSGTGKSWMLNAVAEAALNDPRLPILIESEGTADRSLQKIAERFWYDIHDGDTSLHISRISKRIQGVANCDQSLGFIAFIDDVQTFEEAQKLVAQDWDLWSSSLVFACRREIAKSLRHAFPEIVSIYECQRFSLETLHKLLAERIGPSWPKIPEDVREVLRLPLLASFQCEEFSKSDWHATTEYELYDRVWERVSSGMQVDTPLDEVAFLRLAKRIWNGDPYPWSKSQLDEAAVDDAELLRLQKTGWLQATDSGLYRVSHDRLLQWAVAKSLCDDFFCKNITIAQLADFLKDQVGHQAFNQTPFLGYVPMDVLWLLNRGDSVDTCDSAQILEALESTGNQFEQALYSKLVPTLGPCIADAVFMRLEKSESPQWIIDAISTALQKTCGSDPERYARPLLESEDSSLQRRGVRLLKGIACPPLLDLLWEIHILAQNSPSQFGVKENEKWQLYEETMAALKKSSSQSSEWLISAISNADPQTEPVHDLGYLVLNFNDGGKLWRAVKRNLFAKVDPAKPRCLVLNISKHLDADELEWVTQWIGKATDHVASPALRAVARLDPDRAVVALRETPHLNLYISRKSSFKEVFARRPTETHAMLLGLMKESPEPWQLAIVFQNRENDVTPEILDSLLDDLQETLQQKLNGSLDANRGVHLELRFLSELAAPELISVLRNRANTNFEEVLRDYILSVGPQIGLYRTGLEREPGLKVLNMIGGEGLTHVVNKFLQSEDQFGIHEAIEWSNRRPNIETFELLRHVMLSDAKWPGSGDTSHPVNQQAAMKVLAQYGLWRDVVEGHKKWGMHTATELKDGPKPIVEDWVDNLRQEVQKTPTPGNLTALGTVGCNADTLIIHKILGQCSPDSDLAWACAISLKDLNDRSDTGVELVAKQLSVPQHYYSALLMLSNARTSLAWEKLFKDLTSNFSLITALNLVNLSAHREAVVELVLKRLRTDRSIELSGLLKVFITRLHSDSVREQFLSDPYVRNLLHQAAFEAEGNYWRQGSKADAIECLALFDTEAAFSAATHALMELEGHDREMYPDILMKIDCERAKSFLLGHLPLEPKEEIRLAIYRSLEEIVPTDWLLTAMESPENQIKLAAIEIFGWAQFYSTIDEKLDTLFDDATDEIIQKLIQARERRRDRRITHSLSNLVTATNDEHEKSRYLDALIDCADPGNSHSAFPKNVQSALKSVSSFEARHAAERFEKRRKR